MLLLTAFPIWYVVLKKKYKVYPLYSNRYWCFLFFFSGNLMSMKLFWVNFMKTSICNRFRFKEQNTVQRSNDVLMLLNLCILWCLFTLLKCRWKIKPFTFHYIDLHFRRVAYRHDKLLTTYSLFESDRPEDPDFKKGTCKINAWIH